MAEPIHDIKLTPNMAAILKIFLEDPAEPRYGLELMRLTGQPSGSLYPTMAKLEGAGYFTTGREPIDPHEAGRPARRFYQITGAAVPVARMQLAELSERFRPPSPLRRLAPEGGTA
jgi:DNA-binding PadR family transcriptional regulator